MPPLLAIRFVLATAALGAASSAIPATPELQPFNAHYQVEWHGINVGSGDIALTQDRSTGDYQYVMRLTARGIFKLFLSNEATQVSNFSIISGHAQPNRYRGDDGSKKTAQSVTLDFDWKASRVKGISEDKPVDLPLQPRTQDPMSVQIELMLGLLEDRNVPTIWLADKDEIKEFTYADEGHAHLQTGLGVLDTVVLSGKRPGSDRITRLWFAPALGYIPVQAQRTRNGKVDLAMMVKSVRPSVR